MDKEIAVIKKREEQGLSSMLVTIVADSGSAPRGSGASMIVGEAGLLAGTIGGGMLEFQAIKEAQQLLTRRSGALKAYGLTKDAVAKLGMVCGGKVEVLFTYLAAGEANSQTLARLEAALAARQAGWLLLPLSGLKLGFVDGSGIYGLELPIGKQKLRRLRPRRF
jgi:xanthine dehydrogenase accessory factor